MVTATVQLLYTNMEEVDLISMWFQQAVVTCHIAGETMAQLRCEFGEQLISRLGPVNWLLDYYGAMLLVRYQPIGSRDYAQN